VSSSLIDARPAWGDRIPDREWSVYRRVIQEAHKAGIPVAFGGAFATAVYTGQLRNTKDLDIYLLPEDRDRMREVIGRAGLHDLFDQLPYDRSWIYRGSTGDVIVDAIWAMANQRAQVDARWLSHGPEVTIRGERLRAIPIEELIWAKLYIVQRARCDWIDILNLIDAQTISIDWEHLSTRLEADVPLLAGALSVFGWLAPDRAQHIPQPIRKRLGLKLPPPGGDPDLTRRRANLLDSRHWFTRHAPVI
jgi:Nucleotidyl transferase of unknown function (DUF2204)